MFKYVYNIDYLKDKIDIFIIYVSYKQNGLKVSFNNGYLEKSEGYKKKIVANCKDILDIDHWSLNDINKINENVIKVLKYKDNNIIYFTTITYAINTINTKPNEAAKAFYNLFKTNDDSNSYKLLGELFGYRTDLLSYLMFIKEPNRYVPCKRNLFKDKFEYLGLDNDMLKEGYFTFDKYVQFNNAIEEVARIYSDYVEQISLVDAHSFVWLAEYLSKENVNIPFDKEKEIKKYRESTIQARNNQQLFRNGVIKEWNGQCAVTGCKVTELLRASHIKPFRDCTEDNEGFNPNNGLLLIPDLDILFDQGYITFNQDGSIVISNRLDQKDRKCFRLNVKMKLRHKPNEEMSYFLEYHRKHIFIDEIANENNDN